MIDPVFTCSDPTALPTSINVPVPLGPPVIIGGPPTPDLMGMLLDAIKKKATAKIKNLIGPPLARFIRGNSAPPSRLRNFLGAIACHWTGHPVDVATGRMMTTATDWSLPGPLPLSFGRHYSSAVSDRDGALGFGWNHTLEQSIWLERGRVVYRGGDGREIAFDTFDFPDHRMRMGDQAYEPSNRLTLRCHRSGWTVETADGITHEFQSIPADPSATLRWRLTRLRNRSSHEISLTYAENGCVEWVRDSCGRLVHFEHDACGRLIRVALPHPNQAGWITHTSYPYSPEGNLVAVQDSLGNLSRYEYSGHLMVRETDRNGLSFYLGYDGLDQNAYCVRTWGDGGIFDHRITYDKEGLTTQVQNSLGHRHCLQDERSVRRHLGDRSPWREDRVRLRRCASRNETDGSRRTVDGMAI